MQVTVTTYITAGDGNTYRVSVTYDQDANMPENADLAVRELGDDEKEDYVNQSAAVLETDVEDFAFARAFDINEPDIYYVMWIGKSLYLNVCRYDIRYKEDGSPDSYVENDETHYYKGDNLSPVEGAEFTLTNITDPANPVTVWNGASDSDGKVTVPWSKVESAGGNTAIFAKDSVYELRQTSTDSGSVMPGGFWTMLLDHRNVVTWVTTNGTGLVNRTLDIEPPRKGERRTDGTRR